METEYNFTQEQYRDAIESFKDLKVLIIGDIIFDRYTYVHVQGLTSKNQILSGRFSDQNTQFGGAIAVFRHIKQFVKNVNLISIVGSEAWVDPILKSTISREEDLVVRDSSFMTIIKERFIEPHLEGKELNKLFAVNYIKHEAISSAAQTELESRIIENIANVDVVMIMDFGHGLFQPKIRQLVQERAPFLVLNCQTNSYNYGFNIISRQYQRADAFALDKQELVLSVGLRDFDAQKELALLKRKLNSQYAWLTRGSIDTIGMKENSDISVYPPFAAEVTDTVGAGDAFFSLAGLAAVRGLPIDLATFMGQLAGAEAVKIVGNTCSISKSMVLDHGVQILGH